MNIFTDYAFPKSGGAADGLTKRELFAAMAMQGMAKTLRTREEVARRAVGCADALLAALSTEPTS